MATATYIQEGEVIDFANSSGSAIAYKEVVPFGSRIVVAAEAIADGATGSVSLTGVFEIAAVNDTAFAVGDKLYWDNSAKKLQKTATAYVAGLCVEAKLQAGTTAKVLLVDVGPVSQAATQAASTASTVADLKTDFNTLLAALKTAGIVASS